MTEELYEKYKEVLDLKLERGEEGSNIVLKKFDDDEYLIPNEFFKGSKFYEIKQNFEFILIVFENGNLSWDEFRLSLTRLFISNIPKPRLIKYKNLEKIRFFINFIKINPYFNYEDIPSELQNLRYKSKYDKWRKNSSFIKLYNKYITPDKYFYQKHVNIYPIPNYPAWNLQMTYFDLSKEEFKQTQIHNYYPIQVFEDSRGSITELIALESRGNQIGNKIKSISMINNFNIFPVGTKGSKSFTPKCESIFDSYTKYLDEMESEGDIPFYSKNTYESITKFSCLNKNDEYVIPFLKKRIISEFNLLYDRKISKFTIEFLSDTNKLRPTYRYLFNSHFTFPEFNFDENYLLIINKKKRNIKFDSLVRFLKNWSYQTIVYELKDKIILNGQLLPYFTVNYSKELVYLKELFDSEGIEFRFKTSKQDYKYSNLSIYSLPSSNQYIEGENRWELDELEFPISINNQKRQVANQIGREKILHPTYQ